MTNIFTRLTKGSEEKLLFEEGIIDASGRLSVEGQRVFLDLLFLGFSAIDCRQKMIEEIKKEREENKKYV